MGTSFTTAHIYNAGALTKAQFKKAFTDMMKGKGYTACDEENAALTYTFAFSPDRKWVTVLTDGDDTRREAAELAKGLKAYAVMIDLVDSDFAELSLFDEAGAHKDTLTLGDSYLEDAAPMGDPAAWQPLLCGSWEQVQEIQNGSYTFAEDALAQFAPLIGMDSGDILLDNDSADDNNAVMLHFKKTAEKKLTLNSAFVKVFGEALEPLGFVRLKGLKHIFARVKTDDIIQFITIIDKPTGIKGQKGFSIESAVMTMYRPTLDFKKWNSFLLNGFDSICGIYRADHLEDYDSKIWDDLYTTQYDENDESSIMDALSFTLDWVNKLILPEFEKIDDLSGTIKYLRKHNHSILVSSEEEWKIHNENPNYYSEEDMLYIISGYNGDFREDIMNQAEFEHRQNTMKRLGFRIPSTETFEKYYTGKTTMAEKQYNKLSSLILEKDYKKKCFKECERRKNSNWETLRNLGMKTV